MEREAMDTYVSSATVGGEPVKALDGGFDRTLIKSAVEDCLSSINANSDSKFRLRLATESDVNTIAKLVQGLAEYEKEPDAVMVTAENYLRDGFSDNPLFYCLLLDHVNEDGNVHTCGMAVHWFGYTLGEGRFLYLEDLYLEVDYRKGGGGSLTMQSLARIGKALHCNRLYWQALDWNTPALNFYGKIGAKVQDGVLTSRYTWDSLKAFAKSDISQV
jgi:GNAT superfamily N-acetyltransferase